MRIHSIWIERFKNLQNFAIDFNNYLTSIVIGGNGTGKSNLLEAIAIIFRDLDLELKNPDALPFEYIIEFETRGHRVKVDANPTGSHTTETQLSILGEDEPQPRKTRVIFTVDQQNISMKQFFQNKRNYLPNHVFGYYSGPTNRLAQHFNRHQEIFYEEQRKNIQRPLRPLFFALPSHSQFVLLSYFAFPGFEERDFLAKYVGVSKLESVRFVIRKPEWARKTSDEDFFWGAEGVPRQFLERLYEVATSPIRQQVRISLGAGRTTSEEQLHLFIDGIDALRSVVGDYGDSKNLQQEFFKDLDTLYISRLIADVHIRVQRVGSGESVAFSELSEGEQQLLTVLGLLKFTADSETLFLLDEPDTHLNPAWKYEFLRLIEPIVGGDTQCQMLLATHDPIIIGSCVKEQVRVLAFEDTTHSRSVTWFEPKEDPQGMGVAALLTSELYGLRSSLDWTTQKKLDEQRELASRPREKLTAEEKNRLQKLQEELNSLGFTYSFRDPLFEEYQRLMSQRIPTQPIERSFKISEEERERREEIARKVIEEILNKQVE